MQLFSKEKAAIYRGSGISSILLVYIIIFSKNNVWVYPFTHEGGMYQMISYLVE